MKLYFKIFIMLIMALFIEAPIFSLDYNFGDFSSRSVIENSLFNKTNQTSQEMIDLLKQKGLDLSAGCLIKQIKSRNIQNIRILIEAKINLNQSVYGEYPILFAVKSNDFEIVKLLHQSGAKFDKGFTSELYVATKNGNSQIANYLVDNNAKVDYISLVKNDTALYYALKNNMVDVAQKMINRGVNIDKKSIDLIKKKKLNYLISQ